MPGCPDRGVLAVSAGYRLLGQSARTIDDCLADVRRGVEGFVGLAAARGLRPSHLASGGSSAGGHLALLAAVRPGQPPVLIHHGIDDDVEPIENVRRFASAVGDVGGSCTLVEYPRAGHGFHHPRPGGHFDEVVDRTATFLLETLG